MTFQEEYAEEKNEFLEDSLVLQNKADTIKWQEKLTNFGFTSHQIH